MAIQEIRITPCFEAKILNAKLDRTCLGIISAWIETLHIATHVWNVSQIIYMHNPNLVVYLINPKTFTSLRGGKIVNNDGNPTFKFQIHFCIQWCIGIKDSKVRCACPPQACLLRLQLSLDVYCLVRFQKPFSLHHDTLNLPWWFECPNMVLSLIMQFQ